MSRYFQADDRVLWNPSNGVADLFVRTADMLATAQDSPSGIKPSEPDEYRIDMDDFSAFVDVLVHRYTASRHQILRALLEGFTATAVVLVERAGRPVLIADESPLRGLAVRNAAAMPY